MYFWLAKNIKWILPSRTTLPSGARGFREMDRNIGLMARHIGRAHRAVQIDENIRERLLELDEARGQPERSQAFGDGHPHFARERIGDGFTGAQQIERSGLHA